MSVFKVDIHCKKCNSVFPIILNNVIDLDDNKELCDKITEKTIFDFKCSKCNIPAKLAYSFLCYSKKKKMVFFFSVKDIDEVSKENELEKFEVDSIGDISDFTTRTVYSLEDLNEKIRIIDNGLNDALIEASKIWFVHNSNVNIADIRFDKVVDNFIYWIVFYDGIVKGARLPMDFYQDYEKEWKVLIPNNFELVNKNTLGKYLKRIKE